MISLEFLDLSKNKIKDISSLEGLHKISSLYMFHNKISDLSPLKGLSFTSLNLSNNNITNIEVFETIDCLEGLDLSKNEIEDYKPLRNVEVFYDANFTNKSKTYRNIHFFLRKNRTIPIDL